MLMPTVSRYMTLAPVTIAPDQPMTSAHRLMRAGHLRHLPVIDGGRLVGIVSDRDLHLLETLKDVDPEEVSVEEAMTRDVYVVPPATPLTEVIATMAERRLGSAVVMGSHGLEGLFTSTDALRALLDVLERETT
jgi:acetoin utilization protein AcuB